MAVQTIYLLGTAGVSPNYWGNTQLNGTSPAAANSAFGYGASVTPLNTPYRASSLGSSSVSGLSGTSSFIETTTGPTHQLSIGPYGDSFIAGPFRGTFAATLWTCNFNMRGTNPGATGLIRLRVWRSANVNGSATTEITPGVQNGSTVAPIPTSDTNSQIIFSSGEITLNNEYLFFQTEWQETVRGTNQFNDVVYRIGTSSITTPDFIPALIGTLSLPQVAQTVAAVGRTTVGGSLVSPQAAQTLSATGFSFNFTGRITTRTTGRAIPTFPLSGRIGARNSSRADFAGPGAMYARLTARSSSRGRVNVAGDIAGRITTRSSARVIAAVNPPFSARISARVTARVAPAFALSGRITTRATARGIGYSAVLAPSRITARTTARASIFAAPPFSARLTTRASASVGFLLQPALQGQITIRSSSRLAVPAARLILGGQVTTRSSGAITLTIVPLELAGRITSVSSSQIRIALVAPVNLAGRITTKSTLQSTSYYFVPPILTGRIGARTSARGAATVAPRIPLSGQISTRNTARLVAVFTGTIYFTGNIRATTTARVSYTLVTSLSCRITTRVLSAGVLPPLPLVNLPLGRIITAVKGLILTSELLLPLPPYPPAFPTQSIEYYLNLITSEHINKPRYIRTVTASIAPLVANQELIAAVPGLFDLDYSLGEQEDFTGQWVGKSRWIEVPTIFFSWDTTRAGWNQANWKGPFDADDSLQRLDDYHYRMLLYAAVIANHWNGSIPGAYEAWDTLFRFTGLKVVIQDYGNMTMMYGIMWEQDPDLVLAALFVSGQMDLKPEGIEIVDYIFQTAPNLAFFGFDAVSDSIAGWDSGSWGILVPPGEGSLPIQ